MQILSRYSTATDLDSIIKHLTEDLPSEHWDACLIFISLFSPQSTMDIAATLQLAITSKHFLGCSCNGVITQSAEIERQPAVCLILMKFDHVTVRPFYLEQNDIASATTPEALYQLLDIYPTEKPKFLVLPDPYSIDINLLLTAFNRAYDLCPVIGGLASAGTQAGENVLLLNAKTYTQGCVGLCLCGDVRIETVVSQGCRPIGENFIITRCEGNVIHELGGRTFYSVLEDVLKGATDRDRQLAQDAIFVGIAMNEYQHKPKMGDFLIRMVIGLDAQSGAGAVGDYVSTGQTIQFHVRDEISATHELTELMTTQNKRHPQDPPQGALVFSCNGRGRGLFGIADHDLNIIKNQIGSLPLAGFFCAGEIGPVGGKNFAHGFTSSIALFYPLTPQEPAAPNS